MYFIIINIGDDKYTNMGMINVDAELYLEKGDDKYIAEHYVTVPVIPSEGYPRQKELDVEIAASREGKTVMESFETYKKGEEQIAYEKWISELPTVQQLNPFCTHSIQFEHDVTEEEILWCFEWALGITQWNYLMDDLHCQKKDEKGNPYSQVVNQNINYLSRKAMYEGFSLIPENSRSDYMKSEMNKVDKVKQRLQTLKDVDFANVKTIGKYKVK
ncbi:hypothetical protein ASZ90_008193 [hydrocarbon metagenome]|uniref:Uncharacterized protein n=1 Tax=hydrocarbon metagenome TaxID=938273 RepID=A0A0W8FMJ1_9ZZZZ